MQLAGQNLYMLWMDYYTTVVTTEFAAKVNVDPETLNKAIMGYADGKLTTGELGRIANGLGVSYDWIITNRNQSCTCVAEEMRRFARENALREVCACVYGVGEWDGEEALFARLKELGEWV